MKLVYEFDEKEILEKVKKSGSYDLQRSIVDEIKRQAKDQFVAELYALVVESSTYTKDKYMLGVVEKELKERINGIITYQVEQNFSEEKIFNKIERIIDDKLNEWITTKVYKRLNDIKADVNFYSTKEHNEEVKCEQKEHERELEELAGLNNK